MPNPISPQEWRRILVLTALILIIACVPYWLAYAVPADHIFTGILFNPLDGQSYLAKMQEGWRGAWRFTLPFTAEPGPGLLIFTYYLFLGHLAHWTGLSIEFVYHAARVFAGAFLLLTAYHFIARFFETPRARLGVWLLFALGSGLGWLAAPLGAFTSDLWVAEAIPFLSVFSNSHFCLAAGLMLWILEWAAVKEQGGRLAALALAVTALTQVQPMAFPVLYAVIGVMTLLEAVREMRRGPKPWPRLWHWLGWRPLAVMVFFSGPWLIYDAVAARSTPQFAGWSAQNVTPSPPAWDALLSGGVPLALALLGTAVAMRRRQGPPLVALVWLGVNVILLYLPLALQRRLSLGIWMPIAILAGFGWREIIRPRLANPWRVAAIAGVALLALPSNVLVYAATLNAIPKRIPDVFLTRGEAAALDWLGEHASGKVVVASPDMGRFIPARTKARVLYGHPFETVAAAVHKQAVEDFFSGRVSPAEILAQYPADYVLYGPREKTLGALPALSGWRIVYPQPGETAGEVTIYGR